MEQELKNITDNQLMIDDKEYTFTYNLEKMKIMEKVYKVNLIEELSKGVGALSISVLEALFCQGIAADQKKREGLFKAALEEHTYARILEFLVLTFMNQMGFLFQKNC